MTLRTILFGTGLAAVLVAAPLALADNLDRNIRIKNRTSYTIVEFYASNKSRTTWEEDILGQDVIGAGSYMNINFDDGSGYCKFDFKAVFDDGDVLVDKNINVCEVSTYTYR